MYTVFLSKLTKNKLSYTAIITVIAYAITFIAHTIGIVIQFVPYKILETFYNFEDMYVSLIMITFIQIVLLYQFFKIKRFSNGFAFLNNKLNNEITDIIMLNISSMIIIIYCLVETYPEERRHNLFAIFIILGIIMIFTIQKMLTMYYKQKLLTDKMEE